MELEKKSDVYIFLDTNVFEQCKSFTEIDWPNIVAQFKSDIEYINIILKVPYMVIMELDDHKRFDKKARKTLAKIRNFERINNNKDIKLEISIRPPRWDSLDSNLQSISFIESNISSKFLFLYQFFNNFTLPHSWISSQIINI